MKRIFENTKVTFAAKTDFELQKSYWLFRLLASPLLTKIGTQVVRLLLRTRLPIERLIRTTMFDHFCVGTIFTQKIEKINFFF